MTDIGCDYKMRQVAFASAEQMWAQTFNVSDPNRAAELGYLFDSYQAEVASGDHLWIESAIMGAHSGAQTLVKMANTQGAVMAAHPGPCTVIAPASWKAGLGIGGHASKEDVSQWLDDCQPELYEVCSSQDEVDAMCLSLYGQGRSVGEILAPKPKPKKKRKKIAP